MSQRSLRVNLPTLVLSFMAMFTIATCSQVRTCVHDQGPFPHSEGTTCPPVPWRCAQLVPERCSVSDGRARWYPQNPATPSDPSSPCAIRCVVDGDPTVAHCAGAAQ